MSVLHFLNNDGRHPVLVSRLHEAMAANAIAIAGLSDGDLEREFRALRDAFQANLSDDLSGIAQNWTLEPFQIEIERPGLFDFFPGDWSGGAA